MTLTRGTGAGKFSPSMGFTLPAEGYTGQPEVPCPEVSTQAREYWATWATSPYAHFFGAVEWLNLADATRLMDIFYTRGNMTAYREARSQAGLLFGLAIRARLHITAKTGEEETPDGPGNGMVRATARRKG